MTDPVGALKGITPEEVQALRNVPIATAQDLWKQVGKDFDSGITQVAANAKIKPERLLDLLADEGARDDPGKAGGRLMRHALDVALIAGLIVLAVLALRASGALAFLPAPLGLHESVALVAARDLKSDQVLLASDLYAARLEPGEDAFTSADNLEGLILAHDVPRGRPLRFGDVLRPQMVAATDILSAAIVAGTAVSRTWTVYQPGAAVQLEQVVGHRALQNLRAGEVILSQFVSPDRPLVEQVVVSSTVELPAYHVIGPDEVTLKETPAEADAFTSLDGLVGRYTLRAVAPGEVLQASQLATVHLSWADRADRSILSVPVDPGSLSTVAAPGSRVSLVFSPRSRGTISQPLVLADVIVLAVEHGDKADSLVVAVMASQVQTVFPFLGASDVFVLRPGL